MEKYTFHHIGIAVRDFSKAIPNYEASFGYQLTSGPFDDPIQNVSVCFLSRENDQTLIELVAPLGPNSPVDRVLKKGGGPYHVCYQVANIRQAIEEQTEKGAFLISGPVPAVAFEMREIAWMMTGAELLIELVQE